MSEVLNGWIEKIRVSSAEIVVHGTKKKPYYEIKYRDLSDGQIHVGYSSYNLDFLFEWLEKCFEVVEKDKASLNEQIRELRDIYEYGAPHKEKDRVIKEAADTIEFLSAKLADMEQSRKDYSEEWIPCKRRMPEVGRPVLVCDKQGNVCVRAVTSNINGVKNWSQNKLM